MQTTNFKKKVSVIDSIHSQRHNNEMNYMLLFQWVVTAVCFLVISRACMDSRRRFGVLML
jgi:hypothetical protein